MEAQHLETPRREAPPREEGSGGRFSRPLTGDAMREQARREDDPRVANRLAALARVMDGVNLTQAAARAGVTRRTLRSWLERYTEAGLPGLHDRWSGGRPSRLTEAQIESLAVALRQTPPGGDRAPGAWRISEAQDWVEARFGVRYSRAGMHRLIRALLADATRAEGRDGQDSSQKAPSPGVGVRLRPSRG